MPRQGKRNKNKQHRILNKESDRNALRAAQFDKICK